MLGITWAMGTPEDLALSTPASSPNMTYHGGKIMPTANVTAIFWGTSWGTYHGDKISGMDSWYQGFSNSNYAKTSDEYTGSNGQVGPTTSYAGHYIDTSAAGNGNTYSVVLAEVCKMITNPDPSGNGYYPVYVDTGRGSYNYCGYHYYGSCHGTSLQFAFFFNLDGDAGCDPGDSSGLHSEGLAALANVSAHELSEARTDPVLNAWYDAQGQENGDKCAWTYGASLLTLSNGTRWKMQGEWSNLAYNYQLGYPNRSGQYGCLSAPLPPVFLSESSVDFGQQDIRFPSDPYPITLINNQSVNLSISSITTTGAGFSQTNNCGTGLKANSSCIIQLVFTPKHRGLYTGTLAVTDNGPGSPHTASLTGTGVLNIGCDSVDSPNGKPDSIICPP